MGLGAQRTRGSWGPDPTGLLEFEHLGALGVWAPQGPYRPLGPFNIKTWVFLYLYLFLF